MAEKESKDPSNYDIDEIRATLKESFASGKSRDVDYRKVQLAALAYMIKDNHERFEKALEVDLARPQLENHAFELASCMTEAVDAYDNVEEWAKPEQVPWTMKYGALGPKVLKEPKGVVLIIGTFDFPVWTALVPLAGAIAAGNAAVVVLSEWSPAVSLLLAELVPKYLDPSLYAIVDWPTTETSKLLSFEWSHVLYTGGAEAARVVSETAAKNLTPVTLVLGGKEGIYLSAGRADRRETGKNPVLVDSKVDMVLAAKRIAWGKFSNAGQAFTAPDYVLVPKEAQDKLVEAFTEVYKTFYPEGALQSDSLTRIISDTHFQRLTKLLDRTEGKIVLGGENDVSKRLIAPTVVRDVSLDDPLVQEETFGPVLAIVPVKDLDEAIDYVNAHGRPLALYVFATEPHLKEKILKKTQSGAIVFNDVVLQSIVTGLPFGGIGESGAGYYTGKYGFDTFTHLRSTFDSPKMFDFFMKSRYPPYTEKKLSSLKRLLSPSFPRRPASIVNPHPPFNLHAWFSGLMTSVFGGGASSFNFFGYIANLFRGRREAA